MQHEVDAQSVRSAGFNNVKVLKDTNAFDGITIIKTPGRHGGSIIVEDMKDLLVEVRGIVLKHPNEKTIYIAGDTVWYEEVEDNLMNIILM